MCQILPGSYQTRTEMLHHDSSDCVSISEHTVTAYGTFWGRRIEEVIIVFLEEREVAVFFICCCVFSSHVLSSGQFPSTFVEEVTIPSTKPGDRLYVCINDFSSAEPGNLSLKRGMDMLLVIIQTTLTFKVMIQISDSVTICDLKHKKFDRLRLCIS